KDEAALEGAGRAAYRLGNFASAHSLLERALEAQASPLEKDQARPGELETMLRNSRRILELRPSGKLRSSERVSRILMDLSIAKKRFSSCAATFGTTDKLPPGLEELNARWASDDVDHSRAKLLQSAARQDTAVQLIYDTEVQTSRICGAPGGDDALLLLLAKSPDTVER
ncbi:MAG: hypothetical protein J0G35_00275, partial [Acidobacteriales bacterium]|nr:hypothetical protein [Terriglobales bacterium]